MLLLKLDAQDHFHLKIQKGVQHLMAVQMLRVGSSPSLDARLQSAVRHLPRTQQGTICESGLKHCVGVSVFLFLSRAVDSLTTEMESYKWTVKKGQYHLFGDTVL